MLSAFANLAMHTDHARLPRAPDSPYVKGLAANKDTVAHLAPSRGHCKAFSSTIPPLQVALSFACSVASLSHSPSFQPPGWHRLHGGSLADYLLGWGQSIHMHRRTCRAPMRFHAQAPLRATGVASQQPGSCATRACCMVQLWGWHGARALSMPVCRHNPR